MSDAPSTAKCVNIRTRNKLSARTKQHADVFEFYVTKTFGDFSIVFVPLGLAGIVLGRRKMSQDVSTKAWSSNWILLISAYAVYFLAIHFVPSGDILHAPRYNLETAGPALMLPLHVIWAGFIGLGYAVLEKAISDGKSRMAIEAAILAILACAVGWNYFQNRPYSDKSHDTLVYEYTLNALNSCPKDACLIVAGDEIYPFMYTRYVDPDRSTGKPGIRTDIKLIGWSGEVEMSELGDEGGAMAKAVVRAMAENPGREIDTTFFNSRFLETPELKNYKIARRGILFAFISPGSEDGLAATSEQLAEKSGVTLYQPGLPETYIWNYWGNAFTENLKIPDHGQWLWPPNADIQWRNGEMLLFYGANALVENQPDEARGYFREWAMVEPDSKDARSYLEEALKAN